MQRTITRKITAKDLDCLTDRLNRGQLGIQTAILRVWLTRMLEGKSKYTKKQVANVLAVVTESMCRLKDAGQTIPELTPIQLQQARIYVMFGPGWWFLPEGATSRPNDFYIDARTGAAKFPKRDIYKEVAKLREMAKEAGLDELPKLDTPHNCWIW